jgi:MOSC domain-containing protein YiiM
VKSEQSTAVGTVVAIFLAGKAGESPRAVTEALAVKGRGLEGDRYFDGVGSYSRWPGEGRAVSLIERETLEAILASAGPDVTAGQHRRNIVTSGINLQSLIGRQFHIGDAILRGTRECTVCGYLDRVSGLKLAEVLRKRGGLRADIVADGAIGVGGAIVVM